MNLTEAEDIKRSGKNYTEELYNKDLNGPDNHDTVITHVEPDILECEVKWALRSTEVNQANGCNKITSIGGCHQGFAFIMSANLEDPAVATELEKVNPHPSFQKG